MSLFEGKTILVTGATGLIGSHIVEKLMDAHNIRVIALSRNKGKLEECFCNYLGKDNFRYIAQDVSQNLDLPYEQIDYIFHAAGPIAGSTIQNFPLSVIEPNLSGTRNCFEFLKRQQINNGHAGRVVVFSSATVYGQNELKERIVSEDDTELSYKISAGNAAYSQSKRMAEVIATAYLRQYSIDYVAVRLGYVYGFTKFQPNTAFYEIINKALCGDDIIMNNNKFIRRDNIYVDDAVDGIFDVCLNGTSGEVYNVSSNAELGNYIAIDEMADIVVKIVNDNNLANTRNKVKVIQKDGQELLHQPGVVMNNTKLKAIGWNLKIDIKTGIMKTVKKIRETKTK